MQQHKLTIATSEGSVLPPPPEDDEPEEDVLSKIVLPGAVDVAQSPPADVQTRQRLFEN